MTEAASQKAIDTKERILDAAEELFIEHGFAATSLRAIANQAEVNLAATNYHFGSKDGLLAAVLHRNVSAVNEERLKRLSALEAQGDPIAVRSILEALFYPLRTELLNDRLPAVMGRMFSEPESVTRPIIEQEFGEMSARFLTALGRALPDLSPEQLQWRFHLTIGSMIHLLRTRSPYNEVQSNESFNEGIEELINYSIAGLSSTEVKPDE